MYAPFLFICTAAGLGFEPRYHPPEGCVLPLYDPAAVQTNKTPSNYFGRLIIPVFVVVIKPSAANPLRID